MGNKVVFERSYFMREVQNCSYTSSIVREKGFSVNGKTY